jgi:hypothetical protein
MIKAYSFTYSKVKFPEKVSKIPKRQCADYSTRCFDDVHIFVIACSTMMTMVTPLSQQQQHRKHGGIYVSHRSLCFLILASGCVLMLQFRATLLQEQQTTSVAHRSTTSLIMAMQPRPAVNSVSSLRATYHYTRFTANDTAEQCQFYLAESAIPQGGLGIFVGGQGLLKGDVIGFPDICIYVPDMDNDKVKDWMHMR